MQFQGAVINEQGVTFTVVIVKQHVIHNHIEANRMIRAFSKEAFPGIPVVLMAQDYRGVPTYNGRRDIARFMASVPLDVVPWRHYTLS